MREPSRGTPRFKLARYFRLTKRGITAPAVRQEILLGNVCPVKQGSRSTTRQLIGRLITYRWEKYNLTCKFQNIGWIYPVLYQKILTLLYIFQSTQLYNKSIG